MIEVDWDLALDRDMQRGNQDGRWMQAQISLFVDHVGLLGRWWCPVKYRDIVAHKVWAAHVKRLNARCNLPC